MYLSVNNGEMPQSLLFLFLFTAPDFSFNGSPPNPTLTKYASIDCVVEEPNNFLFSLEMYAGNGNRLKLYIKYDLGHISMRFLHILQYYAYGRQKSNYKGAYYVFWISITKFQDIDITDYYCTMGNFSKKFTFQTKRKYYHIIFELYGQNVDVLFVKNNIKINFNK